MRRRGFTLFEVLVATAIAAVLMIAVLKVTAGIGRTHRSAGIEASGFSIERAVRIVERDLAMRQSYAIEDGGLVIQTLNQLTPGVDSGMRHSGVTIQYRLVNTPDQTASFWVREQSVPENGRVTAATRLDAMAYGVRSLRFLAIDAIPATDNLDPIAIPKAELLGAQLPRGVRVELVMADQPEITLSRDIYFSP